MEEVEQSDTEEDRIYEYLLDSGALNDVHAVAESIASSSTTDWSADGSESEDARRIADRLLEQNAEDVDRALEAIVRDARLATDVRLVDGRWTELLDIGPGRTPRQTLRNLDALARLPFAYDTYAGQYFRKLTKGLEHAYAVDAFFVPAGRVYAKLVDVAPDPDCATESFGSLCEATHLRCLRPDLSKSVAAVCLLIRCMATICVRCAGSKSVRSAVTEFVATVIRANALHRPTGRSQDHPPRSDMTSPYAILCCADPTARWFDRVSRYHSCRSAFFDCLDGDRNLLKIVVSGFFHWMTEPIIPSKSDKNSATTVIRYACCLHAIYLLAKMFEYRRVRTMFPVRVSRNTKIHLTSVSNYCLGYLSANRDRAPVTLTRGLRKLVSAVTAHHHPELIDSIAVSPSCFGVHVLAEVAATRPAVLDGAAVDELFRRKHWRDGGDVYVDSLTIVAAALSERHENVWRLVNGWMPFMEAAATSTVGDDDRRARFRRTLMVNVRCTPLAALTYDLEPQDPGRDREFDWLDPRQRLVLSFALSAGTGAKWLHQTGAFDSLDGHVKTLLDGTVENPSPDPQGFNPQTSVNAIVDTAYSFCASFEGLKVLLGDDGLKVSVQLSRLYRLSYDRFDDRDNGYPMARDVLIMLWLRLIEAATHTFTLLIHADLKLNYQDTLSKLSAENRMDDGTVFVAETTELLTKLLLPSIPPLSDSVASIDDTVTAGVLAEFLTDDANSYETGVWLQKVRATIIRAELISGAETIDTIILFGRRRFDVQFGPDFEADLEPYTLTDMDAAGIRLALRYGSSLGLVSEDSVVATELARLICCDAGTQQLSESRPFDFTTCALFVASRGSRNKCAKARAVLFGLEETSQFYWPPTYDVDADRKAAFGHLVEGVLQQELPEVYNAFKMAGVSWWLLCSGWASDCFLGRLRWPEVCRWLCLAVLFPVDYQVFFFTCLAASRKRQWLEAFNQGRFIVTVYQGDFYDFRLVDYAEYLDGLAKKHQRSISKRLVCEFDLN